VLPKENRLKKRKDFERVFKEGKGFKENFLFLKILENDLNKARFGFIVSRKVSKKATLRNKIKRKLREAVREKLKEVEKGMDGILVASPGLEKKDFWEIKESINKIFQKAGITKP